ncbi:MAG TPA: Glu/Leu/Phe/Val dehydrogenase dimerization domain-containing protein [Solirubrobacterales bacterium]|jgi:leucine dehydrogenase|nr:Glu/Leu/Phe/Val dehydrogenase dimerization domain-containing protein [Solirubrobacterales bacterium]
MSTHVIHPELSRSIPAGFEDMLVRTGERSGATIAIAVHSTALGPALGGARLWHYGSDDEGVADARRLARAMTYKAAAAGLLLGGGKGVICAPTPHPEGELRRAMLLDFGDAVESLGGRYVTAEDVGTGAADMAVIAERTAHVVGLPDEHGGSGDPSPVTARGVLAAMRACLEHRLGTPDPAGVRVCVVGAGHVGGRLATLLAEAGAELTICDLDPSRRRLADHLGAAWIDDPAEAIISECDVLAPCALGGVIEAATVPRLRCRIVCGAANNVLADDRLAAGLATREITYAPDFIANAGGLINVYAELHHLNQGAVNDLVDSIGSTVGVILDAADDHDTTPLAEAQTLAERRLRVGTS